jgi:single-strand DNA-binding protein
MAGVNKVILIGRLGRDPELKYTSAGLAIASFSLATTERLPSKDGNKQERTEWHNIVVFNKQAETVNQYLKKGRQAYIEGRIQTRSWDDKDGNKKYKTEIVANTVQFLDAREGGGSGGQPRSSAPSVQEPSPDLSDSSFGAVDAGGADDDLPF